MPQNTATDPSVALSVAPEVKNGIPGWRHLGVPRPTLPLGGSRCACAACDEYFSTDGNFQRHRLTDTRTRERRCATPAEMTARGLKLNERGVWTALGKDEA